MVDFIRKRCRSPEYSAEDILRARGILQTNGVGQGLENSNAIYPTFSFISHRLCIFYRVTRQVTDLVWVDSDLACSFILLGSR